MAATCSNGHDSDWDDYCSVCGESLEGTPAAGAPAAAEPVAAAGPDCPNCGEAHAEGDIFCENCGLDLLSGTLPDEPAETAAPGETITRAIISVDLAFFERMGFAGVEPPADLPEPVEIELPPTDILVGRHSENKGTFPEIDLVAIFGDGAASTDPAVSSNHCRLHRGANGWTVTDLDSTNGTYLGDESEALTPGRAMSLIPGTPIYVGAWTKVELVDSDG